MNPRAFNESRALKLLAELHRATKHAVDARLEFRAAKEARRKALTDLRDAKKRLTDFLMGRDDDAQIEMPLHPNGAAREASTEGRDDEEALPRMQ